MSRTVSMRWLVAVVAGVVLGMFALTGTAAAPPAGAPVRIVDADDASLVAHVDANGSLQVGGTVGIDSSTPLEVTGALGVEVASDRRSFTLTAGAFPGSGDRESFDVIDARVISIDTNDEVTLRFFHGQGAMLIVGGNAPPKDEVISLPIEVPIDSVDLRCENEVLPCEVGIIILGA